MTFSKHLQLSSPWNADVFGRFFFPHFLGKLGTLETMKEPPRHRVGRAGRFGTKGLALTFVATEEDSEVPGLFVHTQIWSWLRSSRVVAWENLYTFQMRFRFVPLFLGVEGVGVYRGIRWRTTEVNRQAQFQVWGGGIQEWNMTGGLGRKTWKNLYETTHRAPLSFVRFS